MTPDLERAIHRRRIADSLVAALSVGVGVVAAGATVTAAVVLAGHQPDSSKVESPVTVTPTPSNNLKSSTAPTSLPTKRVTTSMYSVRPTSKTSTTKPPAAIVRPTSHTSRKTSAAPAPVKTTSKAPSGGGGNTSGS